MEEKTHELRDMSHPETSDNLIMVIKTYDYKSALTKDLSLANMGTQYKIEGPIVNSNFF